jgi:uncharacterized metal-binding protein YceD (DUF177 family)
MTIADNPPIERIYDLNRVSEAGYEATITASADDCVKLAGWAELDAVERFEGRVSLKRLSASRFAYSAHLEADIVQSCAVTLEPVPAVIVLDFARTLHLVSRLRTQADVTVELTPGADDVPEEIDNSRFDLAAPLLEEFLLAINPYPRAPGVEFEVPDEVQDKPESPFAVLKTLKADR